jgi:hypothetical protein
MLRKILILTACILSSLIYSCTKLEERYERHLTASQVGGSGSSNTTALLEGVYTSLRRTFTNHVEVFALSVQTTDEAMVPTRGPDWDDDGQWRQLHQHKWEETHVKLRDVFNRFGGTIFAATDLLRYNPTQQQEAEARFLRAWSMYWLLDLFDQVPYRDPGESVIQPARIRKGSEALDYIISEIEAIAPALPDGPAYIANKWAAKTLLMKCYLNKGVYANRANPTFSAADMNKVISLADEIINSNKFSFSANYFDNFAPNNTAIGKENIFTQLDVAGVYPDNRMRNTWVLPLHGSQGGSNGVATLPTFYNKFEATDKRRQANYPTTGSPANPGNRVTVGFLVGQQYNLTTDVPLKTNAGLPVIFVPEVKSIETDANLELTGIRPIKYPIDYTNRDSPDNDFVYFRLADVLLMKAEAILRGGTGTSAGIYGNTALAIVNSIRTDPARNASALASINLDVLLDERGRELWWENWRRNDFIRFGKFLLPFEQKNYTSDPKYLVFPIPSEQIAVNTNMKQNTGY